MCAATSQMVAKVAELMELRKMIEDLRGYCKGFLQSSL